MYMIGQAIIYNLHWHALAKPLGFASYADSATGSSGRQGKALVSLVVDDRPVIYNLFIY